MSWSLAALAIGAGLVGGAVAMLVIVTMATIEEALTKRKANVIQDLLDARSDIDVMVNEAAEQIAAMRQARRGDVESATVSRRRVSTK